jgi:hypothetical protein
MLGITLQAELTYSNVLEVLDLPRSRSAPPSVAPRPDRDRGGPSASNPAPMAPFFDAFFMGESEEAFETVLDAIDSAPDRAGRMRLLEQIPSVYVPSLGRRPSSAPSTPSSASRRSRRAGRALLVGIFSCLRRGDARLHPRLPLLPRRHLVPARARAPADQVIEAGLAQLGCTGYDELSLTSLATSDYTDVVAAIEGIKELAPTCTCRCPQPRRHRPGRPHRRRQRPPVVDHAGARGATQRMRDIICKTITDEMIESAIEAAFRAGYSSLKMYFMIGLPRETHDEVQGIVDLGIRAREIGPRVGGRLLGARQRLELRAEAAHAVPVGGMAPRDSSRQAGIHAAGDAHPPDPAVAARPAHLDAEGRLSRGDDGTADVIERAWRAVAPLRRVDGDVPGAGWHDAFAPQARRWTSRPPVSTASGTSCRGITCAAASRRSSCSTSGGRARPRWPRGLPLGRLRDLRRVLRPVRNLLVH